jgi:hypothetical protein
MRQGERNTKVAKRAQAVKTSSVFPMAYVVFWAQLVCIMPVAHAADTVETWDVGASNVDFYAGFDGIGPESANRAIYSDIMLGYGIINRLSAYLGTTLQGNESFGDGQKSIYLGVYGTPVDTDHLDLDLFLNVSVGGAVLSEVQLAPSIELNFDLDPERRSWGAYLRIGMPVYSRSRASDTTDAVEHNPAFSAVVNPGIYLSITENHQILLEYDMSFHKWSAAEHPVDVGGVALGYNVKLSESIELINQVYLDIPHPGEPVAVGLMTGFIATLPSAR